MGLTGSHPTPFEASIYWGLDRIDQRVPEAITVGAIRANDNRASYSNYGWLVDLFAPGGQSTPSQSIFEFIPVPDHGTDGGREGFTGTSASAPHVAGVAALYLEYNPTASPATVSNAIVGNATPGRVGNIPQNCWYDWEFGQYYYYCEEAAPNLLLYSHFVPAPASNPIYESSSLFVRHQYWDVQYREADAGGLSAWTNIIEQCGADQTSRFNASIEVGYGTTASSEANEYRSYWVYRYHRTAFAAMPTFAELNRDMLRISRSADSAQFLANRNAYANEFLQRANFQATYNGLSNQQYVDTLSANASVTLPNRDQLINDLNTSAKTRAQVLREIVESPQVFNALYNEGWVARCYYLYLRRGPDANGFNAWLNVLNSTGDYRGIIHGLIYSTEYQMRFQ